MEKSRRRARWSYQRVVARCGAGKGGADGGASNIAIGEWRRSILSLLAMANESTTNSHTRLTRKVT